jgi:hypothetical protein
MPAPDATAQRQEGHARPTPALQAGTGNWSAFVARDLAPVFAETPWLDIPPNEEGQATLLQGLAVMKQPAFDAAFEQLGPRTPPVPAATATAAAAAEDDPRRFLRQVMNDTAVPLALRIEAAKALLAHPDTHT